MKAATIDAWLVAGGIFFNAVGVGVAGDSAYQYAPPKVVFWLRLLAPAIAVTCTGVTAYRSKTYAKAMDGTKE